MSSNKKIPVTSSTSYATNEAFANDLRTALVSNNAIPTIQESLHNELQRTGWSTNLRAYVTQLMRSGECTNYDELMQKVLNEAQNGTSGPEKKSNGVSTGSSNASAEPGLKIPDSVLDRGIKVVEKEIKKVVVIEGEDEN